MLLLAALGLFAWSLSDDKEPEVVSGWQSTTQTGITFQYPAEFGTTYLHALDWPPQVQVLAGPYNCVSAGSSVERAGMTAERTVGLHKYCVTEVVEGAAGSTYTQYAYAFPKDDKVVILTFTTRAPQCGNYNEPEKNKCELERTTFNLDALIDRIVSTIAP